jgi:KipI family sensor histidine kinase inhibitor
MMPLLVPLGDAALLIRFGETLSDDTNRAALDAARRLEDGPPRGAVEIVPGLVSVLVRYDPAVVGFSTLAGEVRIALDRTAAGIATEPERHRLPLRFDGEDMPEVTAALGLGRDAFIRAHNSAPLRVLATGFAPGFVYCGLHPPALTLPRRVEVRPMVPAGTVLFAAGQTAIAATPIRTGWHVIGTTAFRNFDAQMNPPTLLRAGDEIVFEVEP